jgi:hypothetical protein
MKVVVKSHLSFNSKFSLLAIEPSRNAGVSYLILSLIFFLSSCGSFIIPRKNIAKDISDDSYVAMSTRDYADHLASLKKPFLATPGIKIIRLGNKTEQYLEGLLANIIGKNEIFFKDLKSATITVLDIDAPLYFSLPHGEIFLSKGLIARYIKHESMLVSVLSFELVRSEKILYPKETLIPLGYVPLERIITLNRLSLEEKMEIHKWAYHLTVRSGYDGEYYLSWLQTQNRNTADFILQVGDANQISREESLFKAFLIKHSLEDIIVTNKNSSKSFYTFLNLIRDRVI